MVPVQHEKHDVGHVGGDVSDARAIGDWWQCGNHPVRNLASKVRVSHQPPEVGRLRCFLGTVPLPPVQCGPAWDMNFRVYKVVVQFSCLQRKSADINTADQSAVHLLYQDTVQTCLSVAAVDASERVGHATFGGAERKYGYIIATDGTSSTDFFRPHGLFKVTHKTSPRYTIGTYIYICESDISTVYNS